MATKLCPGCTNKVGPRTKVCKCGHSFSPVNKVAQTPHSSTSEDTKPIVLRKSRVSKKHVRPDRFMKVLNWRALRCGDKVKIIGGSGSYYELPNKTRQYITEKGKALVDCVEKNGVMVFERNGGRGFIYMGRKTRSELCDNLWRAPHKIMIWCENNETPSSAKMPES